MERIGSHVRGELSRFGPADADLAGIVRAWPKAVGATLARNAWPARLARDGTLLVHTSSSTWAFELGRMAADILERLAAEAGADAPKALRFAPGPIPEAEALPADERAPEAPRVTAADAAAGVELAASVGDEELRAFVARAAAAGLARARAEGRSDRRF